MKLTSRVDKSVCAFPLKPRVKANQQNGHILGGAEVGSQLFI